MGMAKYGQPNEESITATWNRMQEDFECCGAQNYTDWETVPRYCCIANEDQSTCTLDDEGDLDEANLWQKGCLESLHNYVEDNIITIGGIGIGLAFIQIVGIFLAC